MIRAQRLLKSTVGIVCPSCNPDDFMNVLVPSVEHITEIASLTKWLINFNGTQWSNTDVESACQSIEAFGFEVRAVHSGVWQKPMQLVKMREQCAELDPDCGLYLFVDDDFKFVGSTEKYPFSSGRRYQHSIDYMTRYPKCGVLNTKSFLGGSPQKLSIIPIEDDMIATNRGLLLKNMSEHGFLLAPPELRELRGGLEETLFAYSRVELGYYIAKQFNNPTIHITGKLSDWDEVRNDFHNIGVINENIAGYFRQRYGEWEYDTNKIPDAVHVRYFEAGGRPVAELPTINYAEFEEGWDEGSIGRSQNIP